MSHVSVKNWTDWHTGGCPTGEGLHLFCPITPKGSILRPMGQSYREYKSGFSVRYTKERSPEVAVAATGGEVEEENQALLMDRYLGAPSIQRGLD